VKLVLLFVRVSRDLREKRDSMFKVRSSENSEPRTENFGRRKRYRKSFRCATLPTVVLEELPHVAGLDGTYRTFSRCLADRYFSWRRTGNFDTRWRRADTNEDTHQSERVSWSLTLCPSRPDLGRAVLEIARVWPPAFDGTLYLQCLRQIPCPYAQI